MRKPLPTVFTAQMLSLGLVVALYGCNDNERAKTLGENEYYVGDRLASLSADADSTFWIGGETGKVWHVEGNKISDYITGTDRIYKIATRANADGDTTCWLGVRNSGLQVWTLRNGHMRHVRTYDILFKHGNYSAYDFAFTPQGIFTATSQGLYLLRPDQRFTLLHPSLNSPTAKAGMPFIIYNLCPFDDRYLFAASIGGLLRVDLCTMAVDMLHEGENVQHVTTYDGKVCLLADKNLYIDDANGRTLRKVKLNFLPHLYYKAGNVHYLLRNHSMMVSEDLETFLEIPLRRDVPTSNHNLMLPDKHSGFTLLVTENALWRIPFHSGYFNNKGTVIAACANNSEAYFLNNQNELFRKTMSDSVAVRIFTLPRNEQVSKMVVTNDRQLYYVSGRSELRVADISGNHLRNELFARIRTLYHSKERITALHIATTEKGKQAYIGIQDGLVIANEDGAADTIKSLADRYITAFASLSDEGGIYMSTMDAGIIYGQNGSYHIIPQSGRMTFIRDLFVTDGYQPSLTVLTNHALVMPNSQDTIPLNGYNRLVAMSDTLFYAVPEFGIHKYLVQDGHMQAAGHFFDDIHFHAQSSFRLGPRLYMASDIGVLCITPGQEDQPSFVSFNRYVPTLRLVIAGLSGLLAIVGLIIWGRRRRRHEQRQQILLRIQDLLERTQGMSTMATLLSESEQLSVKQLQAAVSTISADAAGVNETISRLSEEIMHKNRDWALQLSKVLETQVREISMLNAYDCTQLIEQSRAALAQDSVSQISRQAMQNKVWLQQYAQLTHDIGKYASCSDDCLLVEGVNDTMPQVVEQLRQNLRSRSIADMQADIEAAEKTYQAVFTPLSQTRILQTLADFGKRISTEHPDSVEQALLTDIAKTANNPQATPVDKLRKMLRIEALVRQVETRRELQEKMRQYRQARALIVEENEKRVNKKFDMKLEVEIADHTQIETDHIEQLITTFYDYFSRTDGEVVARVLSFANFTNQQARVLALLIADAKVKRTLLPGMLGMYGNLNPVISRLVNNKIKPHEAWLKAYTSQHPASMTHYILQLSI